MNNNRNMFLLIPGILLGITLFLWGQSGNPLSSAQNERLRTVGQLQAERTNLFIHFQGEQFIYNDMPVDISLLDERLKRDLSRFDDDSQVLIYITPETPEEKVDEISRLMHDTDIDYVLKEN